MTNAINVTPLSRAAARITASFVLGPLWPPPQRAHHAIAPRKFQQLFVAILAIRAAKIVIDVHKPGLPRPEAEAQAASGCPAPINRPHRRSPHRAQARRCHTML